MRQKGKIAELALGYGGFSYTRDTSALKVGPVELTVKEKKSVNIPVWAGVLPLALCVGPLQPEAGCAERQLPAAPAFIGG